MKLFRKIDAKTGNLLEDMLFESHPTLEDGELDPQYVEEAPPQGFYWPKWNGADWVEGGQAPEPTTPPLSTDEKLTQMVEQLVIIQANIEATQEALDFLFIGRNVKWRDIRQ